MSESRKNQMRVFAKLEGLLTPDTIEKLKNALEVPAAISEEIGTKPIKFLNALRNWDEFNPKNFDLALRMIDNQTILHTARQLEWLSSPSYKQPISTHELCSTKSLKRLLITELTSEQWVTLTTGTSEVSVEGNESANEMFELCIENGIITRDMEDLGESLEIIKRSDLAVKVRNYQSTFKHISNANFRNEIFEQIEHEIKENLEEWQISLRKFLETQNKDVSVVLDEAAVPIESVYTPLTVIQIKLAKEEAFEESGLNEIEFLRNIHQQVELETVEVVDFEEIVIKCDSSESKLWCLIGHPGSGKSFLCKHFGYMYGTHTLNNFQYTVSIPCRSKEWHLLEKERHEKKQVVNSPFIVSWLQLSMSTSAKWSKALSEHLVRSDGEGLLMIMDGADEFTRSVPFETTLLCKLLERHFLTRSTILLTSRPSAWYDFKYTYGAQFHIDSNFQVLGFSPANRDLYFQKRIETISKLIDVHEMFHRHDEIKQLSLVPVNASLFSALFNATESILTQTLSHLYTQLIVYIVRRQLSRMELKEQSKILVMSKFHPAIRDCINTIGLEANQGIFERELTSEKNISLTIDDKVYDSERLGLMQVHMKVVRFGVRVKVWTFQHLTIQEYMAAVSMCNNSWTNQCFILRYLTSSVQYLSMYKMVIRFMGGILRQDAGRMTPILCRHTLPKPLSLRDAAMQSQLYYDTVLVDVSDWKEFTQSYLLLTTVISEMNSHSIREHFAYFKREFSYPLYVYFLSTISPNEWHCFLQSLSHIREYQIIYIQSDYVTSVQFQSFLNQIYSCSIHYLALAFVRKNFDAIYPYTSILSSATLPPNTWISIDFTRCNLTTSIPSQQLFTLTNQFAGSLYIDESAIHYETLDSLTNQFHLLENLYYMPIKNESDRLNRIQSIRRLVLNHPINGIFISDEEGSLRVPLDTLSYASSLKELNWSRIEDAYAVLPYLQHLSSLTFLMLFSSIAPPYDYTRRDSLAQLIATNSNSLREIYLVCLDTVGFHSWSNFLNCIASCSNLMTLRLSFSNFHSYDVSCWYSTISALKSLVYLALRDIPLQDSGMMVLCGSLVHHSAMRWLWVQNCELSSASCHTLSCLIPTLPKIRKLELSKSELSIPDSEPLQRLIQTAEKYSVEIKFPN